MESKNKKAPHTVKEAIEVLSKIDPTYGDIYDVIGIIVGDTDDMLKAKSKNQFQKQKFDLRRSIKTFLKVVNNTTYKVK